VSGVERLRILTSSTTRAALALSMLMLFATHTAVAHHSFASFDMSKTLTLSGTVRAWEWTNPHSWIWLDVPDGQGGSVTWGLEGTGPGELTRHGWNKHSINVGDKISVMMHPMKDGKKGGSLIRVTLPDGHTLENLPPKPPTS
jgi:hypothetical protein